jgi:hypothetical protein
MENEVKELRTEIVGLKVQQAAINVKLDNLSEKLEKFNTGINRGLWIVGGGFLAALTTWITGGGLSR